MVWGPGLPSYYTHAVECIHFDNLSVDGVREQVSPGSLAAAGPTVMLQDGRAPRITDIISTTGKKKWMLTNVTPP